LPLYQRALAIIEKTLGENHPNVATGLNNLALLYKTQGRYEEALPLFQRALAIFEKSLSSEHPNTKTVAENYAALLEKMSES
jgi:tetratricopeptide (TPR) repeat protein